MKAPIQKQHLHRTPAATKPLAWWKNLLIAAFGTYVATKLFGILIPDIHTAGLSVPMKDKSAPNKSAPADTYTDDTWDIVVDGDAYLDDCADGYDRYDDPLDDDSLHSDWDDWNEGYDDDHFR